VEQGRIQQGRGVWLSGLVDEWICHWQSLPWSSPFIHHSAQSGRALL